MIRLKEIIKLVFSFLFHLDAENVRSLRQRFQLLLSKIKEFIITLNLFKDPEKESAHDLRNQRISTRLFIVLMIITLSVLVLYTSLTIITQTVTIKQPTVNVYTELQTKYSQTLICPCTQISIDYEQFISFDPTFHQICSSDFITTKWMEYFIHYPSGSAVLINRFTRHWSIILFNSFKFL